MDSTIRTRPGGALLAALAAGAMLTMIAQTMLPEACTPERAHYWILCADGILLCDVYQGAVKLPVIAYTVPQFACMSYTLAGTAGGTAPSCSSNHKSEVI